MVFGFAAAVIAGFLLTAVKNWTGLPTPRGAALAGLAGLWLAGRVLNFSGPPVLAAALDVLFLPVLAATLAIPILRSSNTRNIKILLVLAALAAVNACFHLAWQGQLSARFLPMAMPLALDIITLLMAIVAGRVIPVFTANAVAGATPKTLAGLELLAIGSLLIIPAARLAGLQFVLPGPGWALLFAVAAVAHGLRLLLWQPHKTRGNLLLLMLPVAYAWIPLSLALQAAAAWGYVAASAGIHALTIGAMASLMMAMMTRSALGHTGRPLRAGITEISAFALLQLAAITRLGANLLPAGYYRHAVLCSALLWTFAFVVFLWKYMRLLLQPRIDGKPG